MVMSEEDQKAKKKRWPASSVFSEKRGERLGQRRKRFLEFLRSQPMVDQDTGERVPVGARSMGR